MKLRRKTEAPQTRGAVVRCATCNRTHGRNDACAVKQIRRGGIELTPQAFGGLGETPSKKHLQDWHRAMKQLGFAPIPDTDNYVAPNRAMRRAERRSAKRRPDNTALTTTPLKARVARRRKAAPNWPQKPTTLSGVSRKRANT